jgi:hypothetical protein
MSAPSELQINLKYWAFKNKQGMYQVPVLFYISYYDPDSSTFTVAAYKSATRREITSAGNKPSVI